MFRFQQVPTNSTLEKSCLIVNNISKKVLDVPKATRSKGEKIIQWERNKRWNQLWSFQRHGLGVIIRSFFNELCLDVCGNGTKSGTDIIQWTYTGTMNQIWTPLPCGNGLYKFRACHENTLFLAVKKQKLDDGAQVEVSSEENPTMYWRVDGAQPC
jgi:hypothetical protein